MDRWTPGGCRRCIFVLWFGGSALVWHNRVLIFKCRCNSWAVQLIGNWPRLIDMWACLGSPIRMILPSTLSVYYRSNIKLIEYQCVRRDVGCTSIYKWSNIFTKTWSTWSFAHTDLLMQRNLLKNKTSSSAALSVCSRLIKHTFGASNYQPTAAIVGIMWTCLGKMV